MDREQVNWLTVSQKGPLFNCLGYNSLGFGATIVAEKEEKVLVLPCGLQVIGYFMLMPVFLSAEITEERKVQRSRRFILFWRLLHPQRPACSAHHALGAISIGRTLVQLMPVETEGLELLALMLHSLHAQATRLWLGEFWPRIQQISGYNRN